MIHCHKYGGKPCILHQTLGRWAYPSFGPIAHLQSKLAIHTCPMSATTIQLIVDRAERLLLRHEETLRTNALLASELKQVRAERDVLKARAEAAKARLDDLIARLPEALQGDAPGAAE